MVYNICKHCGLVLPLISQPVPKCRLTASPGGSQVVQTFSLYALVGVDAYVAPHTRTPKGRFVLRADAIHLYSQRQFSNSACKA